LGCTAHPRRTPHAGLRAIGDDRHPLDEASTQAPRTHRRLAFLRNHREAIAAMDFFTVPTLTFSVLYCSSSLAMIVAASCTSMSLVIQRAVGFCSNYAKPFPTSPRPSSSSMITTQSMDWKYRLRFDPWQLVACRPRSRALGRMESRNAGSAVAGASCSTRSFR
jgi:hypothetical protein